MWGGIREIITYVIKTFLLLGLLCELAATYSSP